MAPKPRIANISGHGEKAHELKIHNADQYLHKK